MLRLRRQVLGGAATFASLGGHVPPEGGEFFKDLLGDGPAGGTAGREEAAASRVDQASSRVNALLDSGELGSGFQAPNLLPKPRKYCASVLPIASQLT